MGYISQENKINILYNLCDVYLLPTLADNLPNTMVEAMSAGIPTVAFDTGGCSEVVIDGQNGMIAQYNDVENFVKKAITLLNRDLNHQCSINSRAKILKSHQMSTQIENYIKCFKDAT